MHDERMYESVAFPKQKRRLQPLRHLPPFAFSSSAAPLCSLRTAPSLVSPSSSRVPPCLPRHLASLRTLFLHWHIAAQATDVA